MLNKLGRGSRSRGRENDPISSLQQEDKSSAQVESFGEGFLVNFWWFSSWIFYLLERWGSTPIALELYSELGVVGHVTGRIHDGGWRGPGGLDQSCALDLLIYKGGQNWNSEIQSKKIIFRFQKNMYRKMLPDVFFKKIFCKLFLNGWPST